MSKRYVVECEWSGPRSPAGGYTRLQHRQVIREKPAQRLKKIHAITFGDGTHMFVRVRECKPRERVEPILGYRELIEKAIYSDLEGWVNVEQLSPPQPVAT